MLSLKFLLLGLSCPFFSSAAVITQRSLAQGWSLQSNTCPSGTTSCQAGACCPSGFYCFAAQTDEAASCCSSSTNFRVGVPVLFCDSNIPNIDTACVGAIEGSPKCADSSWSLWQGFQGNDFCCQVGLVGVYQSTGNVAGSCVASSQVGTATTARLVSL